jgi:hypothetical protein
VPSPASVAPVSLLSALAFDVLRSPSEVSPAQSGRLFDDLLNRELGLHLTKREMSTLGAIRVLVGTALESSRRGELSLAAGEFRMVAERVRRLGRPVVASLGAAFLEAAGAYFECSLGRWETAEQRLMNALSIDDALEGGLGIRSLHLHRIQLLHNLMRVRVRSGRAVEAAEGIDLIASYILGTVDSLPFLGEWSPARIRDTNAELRKVMLVQVVGEFGLMLTTCATEEAIQLMDHFRIAGSQECRQEASEVTDWYGAKLALLLGDDESFLERAGLWFGRPHRNALWHALAWDLAVKYMTSSDDECRLAAVSLAAALAGSAECPGTLRRSAYRRLEGGGQWNPMQRSN